MDLAMAITLVIVSLIGLAGFFVDRSSRSETKPIVLEKEAWNKFVKMLDEPKRANQYLLEGMSRYNRIQKERKLAKTDKKDIIFPSVLKTDPMELDGKTVKLSTGIDTNPDGQTCVTIGGYDKNENRLYILSTFMVDK